MRADGWVASLAALEAAQTADIATSVGHYEANPLLGAGPFGRRQIAIKITGSAAVAVVEVLAPRRWRRFFTWANFSGAGVTGAVAIRNSRLR